MAHIEKMTFAAARQPINHDFRRYTSTRDHIDPSLSHKNYNLAPAHDPWQFVKDKIDMSKKSGGRVNSRSVAVVSTVVTLPAEFKGDERLFFESVFKFLCGIFGAENVVSAVIHYDEPGARPHIHFKAVPLLFDADKGIYQLNAKKVVSRSFLRRFHKDMDDYLCAVFGYRVGILNGATKEGNLTVSQLKEQRAQIVELSKDYSSLVDEYDALVDEYNSLLDTIKRLEDKKSDLSLRVEVLKKRLDEITIINHRVANDILGDDEEERQNPFNFER